MPDQKKKDFFLKKKKEIEEVFSKGKRCKQSGYSLVIWNCGYEVTKGNVVIAKRYGNSPQRNRAKRRFKDILIRLRHLILPGYLFVIIPNTSSEKICFASLKQSVEKNLKNNGIICTEQELK